MAIPSETIDVHAHFISPEYRQALIDTHHDHLDPMDPGIPTWTPELHLSHNAQTGTTHSILSLPPPGPTLYPTAPLTAQLCRNTNTYASTLTLTHPSNFSFFASLPLPYITETLAEIDIALADNAVGFVLLSNYGGLYLGDPAFSAIFERLNNIETTATNPITLLIHPSPPLTGPRRHHHNVKPLLPAPLLPSPLSASEPPLETARTFLSLLLHGVFRRYPNISFIFPDLGGAIPSIVSYVSTYNPTEGVTSAGFVGDMTEGEARKVLRERCYFDCAAGFSGAAVKGLLLCMEDENSESEPEFDKQQGERKGKGNEAAEVKGRGRERLLHGSNFPFTSTEMVVRKANAMKRTLAKMDTGVEGDETLVKMVFSGNAKRGVMKGVMEWEEGEAERRREEKEDTMDE